MTTTATLDIRIMRRCMPFIADAAQRPEQPEALHQWAAGGMLGLAVDLPGDSETITFRAGVHGSAFCQVDSKNVGLWLGDGGWVYLPDPILDDDLDGEPIELSPAK